MMRLARLILLSSIAALTLLGCSASHMTSDGDAGTHPDALAADGGCVGSSSLICVDRCGTDAGRGAVCLGGVWRCPPGTVDLATCPPGCFGPPPSPGCVCERGGWSCTSALCPDGIDPWGTPGTACTTEGAHCTNGVTDSCGSAIACDCTGGHWSCRVAEPDPVCTCGRRPSAGDRCSEEGAACGECCPTAGGTGWAPMTCALGHWQPMGCPELVCPPVAESCPVARAAALGRACSSAGQICGNPCCGTGFWCSGGVWTIGPDVLCDDCMITSFACGAGTCESGQACTSQCGPTDGIEYACTPLAAGCTSCDCATVPPGFTCETRAGGVFFAMDGFCG